MPNGVNYIDSVKNRKDSSEIVAFEPTGNMRVFHFDILLNLIKEYIYNQKWKCRYCNHVNDGGTVCKGTSQGGFPSGGPRKSNNNVFVEYEYFLSKSNQCSNVYTHLIWTRIYHG